MPTAERVFSSTYKRYVLVVLTLVYTLNFLDRGLIGLLLQPIKEDLHLSDTQLGFLTGLAFGLFYAVLGLPIARWADRGDRTTIASLAIALWGATVMVCVFVVNFWQLLLARVAAGVGESGCMPPTYSLLGDYFPKPAERLRAMGFYMLASPVASLVSFMAGGWLAERYGWRITFFVSGLPAVMVALLVKASVREPRNRTNWGSEVSREQPSGGEVFAILWGQRSSRHLILALILLGTMGLGLAPWYGAFMMRSHHMAMGELGRWLGLIFGVGGCAGSLLGGYVTSRWFAEDEAGILHLSAGMITGLVPCFLLFLLLPDKYEALTAMIPLLVIWLFVYGPTYALLQRLVPDGMRATTLAIVWFLSNLIGMGVGPQIVGILSDLLVPLVGDDSLRYAMLSLTFVALWSAYHCWQAAGTIEKDVREAAGPLRVEACE
jgi:MFS family permease